VRIAGASEILNRGQQTRRDYANMIQTEPFIAGTNLT
jgi:hypothetical protein